ncbi:DUF805 domain-containing protein [Rickettsiales endosymbiont of Trichoplax sp. H2]|uniref:DUF805 domain-containing protein n=1 Tax=Rickettsiales endosymbiont of Trichoplax sp. H2 TaxID=2021221 RepID=UPI0012B36FE5|nr:DUF805 domain-containing protein [Rickettsiales endosymbiont of Trichoplax sp. H2]MSO13420.1 Inner membrane protein YhaH [Rickettsiales endosymbiont of Trichoplax sp. H2]
MLSKLIKFIDVVNLPNRINRVKCFALIGIYTCLIAPIIFILEAAVSNMLILVTSIIIFIVLFVMLILIEIKRLHDFNCSGWFLLLKLIPVIGVIFNLFIFFMPGSKGNNRFGPAPGKASKLENLIALLSIPTSFLIIYCFYSMLH